MTAKMQDFEGQEVHRATVKIVGAGDGLSDALKIDPEEIHKDEDRYFVIRARCSSVSFPTDAKGLTSRAHTMSTTEITMVEESIAKKFLQAAADNLARAKAEMEGQMQLDADEDLEGQEALASMREGSLAPEFLGE